MIICDHLMIICVFVVFVYASVLEYIPLLPLPFSPDMLMINPSPQNFPLQHACAHLWRFLTTSSGKTTFASEFSNGLKERAASHSQSVGSQGLNGRILFRRQRNHFEIELIEPWTIYRH